jgi:hypothetical protein
VGNTCGFQPRNLVSGNTWLDIDLGDNADCSYSIIGTSSARLYPLSIMVGGGDFLGKIVAIFTLQNKS